MEWKTMVHLYHVSNISNKKNVLSHIDYLMRKNECLTFFSNTHNEKDLEKFKKKEKEIWKKLNSHENRINARLQSRLIIPVPNSFDTTQVSEIFDAVTKEIQKIAPNIAITGFFHVGKDRYKKRDNKLNKHLHIIYSNRDIVNFKKIRSLTDKKSSYILLKNIKNSVSNVFKKYVKVNNNRIFDLNRERVNHNSYQKYLKTDEVCNENLRVFLKMKKIREELIVLYKLRKKIIENEEKKMIDNEIKKIIANNRMMLEKFQISKSLAHTKQARDEKDERQENRPSL